MEQSRSTQVVEIVPPRILQAQLLAATKHYPGFVFSVELDIVLLRETVRFKVHRTSYYNQLESFEILRDNLISTKKIRLTEYSALHGRYITHKEYPTGLQLQHRFVTLVQKFETGCLWAPRTFEISSVLLERNKLLRKLKQTAENKNIQLKLCDPPRKSTKNVPEGIFPVALEAKRVRSRGASSSSKKNIDENFYYRLPIPFTSQTLKKNLPRRKTRRVLSYAEEVNTELEFPVLEPIKGHTYAQSRSKSTPVHETEASPTQPAFRKAAVMSPTTPSNAPIHIPPINLINHDEPRCTHRDHFSHVKTSGISKPSSKKNLARLWKDFPMGFQTEVKHTPVCLSRFLSNKSPLSVSVEAEIESDGDGVAMNWKKPNRLSIEADHVTRPQERNKYLGDTRTPPKHPQHNLGNKVNNSEAGKTNLDQMLHDLRMEMVSMRSQMRKDIEKMHLEMGKIICVQSEIRKEMANLNSQVREDKVKAAVISPKDSQRNEIEPMKRAKQSAAQRNPYVTTHGRNKLSESNESRLQGKLVDNQQPVLSVELSGNTSDGSRSGDTPGDASGARESAGTHSSQHTTVEDGEISKFWSFSTFTTRLARPFGASFNQIQDK
ncbi:unnamed protein product [Agarophyton chilense]|eukprot:gb/GEZJ01003466.1/.p1 GENE.gb/GEZJ01003466.1/~~gb/GEZJ01003466.1/.p1  ORF type:complete len:606 (+),score=63.13 gb/GEZJ01003466.1/:469-2286(+)